MEQVYNTFENVTITGKGPSITLERGGVAMDLLGTNFCQQIWWKTFSVSDMGKKIFWKYMYFREQATVSLFARFWWIGKNTLYRDINTEIVLNDYA